MIDNTVMVLELSLSVRTILPREDKLNTKSSTQRHRVSRPGDVYCPPPPHPPLKKEGRTDSKLKISERAMLGQVTTS